MSGAPPPAIDFDDDGRVSPRSEDAGDTLAGPAPRRSPWEGRVKRSDPLAHDVRRTVSSFLNLFWRNDSRRWDRSYAGGEWTFLDAAEQAPRHRAIARMLGTRGDAASSVLDVGCGTGALLRHLPDNVARYVGIDLSSEAIRICRAKQGGPDDRIFEATSFDDYAPAEGFRVVVFNEVLYYYPPRRIPHVLARARALLAPGPGAIIVSVHRRSLKKRAVWRRLHACLDPAQRVEAVDPDTGASWQIERYDIVGHPPSGGVS